MKKESKAYIGILFVVAILSACSSVLKRQIAGTESSYKVKFYDAESCSESACTEKEFNISDSTGSNELNQNLDNLIAKSKSFEDQATKSKEMDEAIQFHLGHKSISQGAKVALKSLRDDSPFLAASKINEIFASIKNNFIPPIDSEFQVLLLPIEFFKRVYYNKVDKVDRSDASFSVDPEHSTFWNPHAQIADLDLFTGFSRSKRNLLSDQVCEYDKSKSGWGMNPGFHIRCENKKFKVKLGNEVYSGPFNTRMYWALGYHVPVIDYINQPVIKYDRRLLTEFNDRGHENFKFKLGSKVVYKAEHVKYYSPFDFVNEVELQDGKRISSSEFKSRLFKNSKVEKAEIDPSNYDLDFEKTIKFIGLKPAAYLEKSDDQELGPWRYDQLGHENRREIRGMQVLAAWLGNFDMRMDNTRLTFNKSNPSNVTHALVDVGSGLGRADFLPLKTSSEIEQMPWTVTTTYHDNVGDETVDRLQITGLMNIEVNKAFKKMSFQDGQWMVNRLCKISDNQVRTTLISAGLNSAEATLAFEKLMYRRTQMVKDFEMDNLLPNCLRVANQKLNYSQSENGLFTGTLLNGTKVFARSTSQRIQNGHLN